MSCFKQSTTLSGRAARRRDARINREEEKKEEAARKLAWWRSLSPEERVERVKATDMVNRVERNGITLEDLNQSYNDGIAEGYKIGKQQTFEMMFAAMALALEELHGFDGDQCLEVLNLVHEKVFYALSTGEMIAEVFDRMGLELVFSNMPDEVVEKK